MDFDNLLDQLGTKRRELRYVQEMLPEQFGLRSKVCMMHPITCGRYDFFYLGYSEIIVNKDSFLKLAPSIYMKKETLLIIDFRTRHWVTLGHHRRQCELIKIAKSCFVRAKTVSCKRKFSHYLGMMHYCLSNACPFIRGSASIIEWMSLILTKNRFPNLFKQLNHVFEYEHVDCHALSRPYSSFSKWYKSVLLQDTQPE